MTQKYGKTFVGILRLASLGVFLASCAGGDDDENDNPFVLHVETGASGGQGDSRAVTFCKPGFCTGPTGRGGAGGGPGSDKSASSDAGVGGATTVGQGHD